MYYFRATILAISAYLETFQKIADAATNARGKLNGLLVHRGTFQLFKLIVVMFNWNLPAFYVMLRSVS